MNNPVATVQSLLDALQAWANDRGELAATSEAHRAGLELLAQLQAAPPECTTEAEKVAFAFGWWTAMATKTAPPAATGAPRYLLIDGKLQQDAHGNWVEWATVQHLVGAPRTPCRPVSGDHERRARELEPALGKMRATAHADSELDASHHQTSYRHCDGQHDLQDISHRLDPTPGVFHLTRWCANCGAVVIDTDVDGRTHPGKGMPMRFPRIAQAHVAGGKGPELG